MDSSLVQRNPTSCGISACDHETSIMRRLWPTMGWITIKKKIFLTLYMYIGGINFIFLVLNVFLRMAVYR